MPDRDQYRTLIDFSADEDTCLVGIGHYLYPHAMPPLKQQFNDEHLVLAYLLSGLQLYEIDGQRTILRGGQGIIFPPGTRYGSSRYPEQKGELIWLTIDLTPPPPPFPCFSTDASAEFLEDLLSDRSDHRFPLSPSTAGALRQSIKSAKSERSAIDRTRTNHHLAKALLETHTSLGQSLDQSYSAEIRKVLQWIESNLGEEETRVEKLAQLVGLSPSHLHRQFKEQTGLPPSDYMLRRRIIEAQRLLTTTSASVTDIAMQLGFSSSQYFATAFRRYTLVSPSAWRGTALG